MKPIERIFSTAQTLQKHIVLPEGDDDRILEAAILAVDQKLAEITLLGDVDAMVAKIGDRVKHSDKLHLLNPKQASFKAELAQLYFEKRKAKGMTLEQAKSLVLDPLVFAPLMVEHGVADGCVAGAVATTADVVRNALQIIGKAEDAKLVSSLFLMLACKDHHGFKGGMIFADCGLNIAPDETEIAEIAMQSAESCKQLLSDDPRIAMLSFSTNGSAKHPNVNKMVDAMQIVRETQPDLTIDGEIQFDAAFADQVRKSKMPNSVLTERPNIFVFPSLEAGNIGYKIAQQLGGLDAIGPILQGLKKPCNDLSRGCNVDDVLSMIAITAVQTQ